MLTTHALIAATAMLALTTTVEMTLPAKRLPANAGDCAARRWVDQNLDHLPTTYEEFPSYPVRYRKMIYERLPLETRAAFWRVHIDRFMAEHDLTPAQAALVGTIRANISEYLAPGARVKADSVYTDARRVLGVQLTRGAFMHLVPARAAEFLSEACSCSTVHDDCPHEPEPGNPNIYDCGEDGDECDPISCGRFNWDTCNGECLSVEQT